MNELQQLEKLELASSKISEILQNNYEVEPMIADELSLYFLSNNFQAMQKVAKRKAYLKRFINTISLVRLWKAYYNWRKYSEWLPEISLALLAIVIISFLTIIYLVNTYSAKLPYHGVASDDFVFSEKLGGTHTCTPDGGVCIPNGSQEAFDYQIKNLQDGQTIDMVGHQGHTITLTKRNKQIIFVEHE